jgi:hypothetical protein
MVITECTERKTRPKVLHSFQIWEFFCMRLKLMKFVVKALLVVYEYQQMTNFVSVKSLLLLSKK